MVREDTVLIRIQVWDVHGNNRSNEWTVEWSAAQEEEQQSGYAYDRDHSVSQGGASVRISRNTFLRGF